MRKLWFISLLLWLPLCSIGCLLGPSQERVTVTDLVGNWVTVQGYDASEISFSVVDGEAVFSSFLQGRSYEGGTWKLEGAALLVFASGSTYTYKKLTVQGDQLTFMVDDKKAVFKLEEGFARRKKIVIDLLNKVKGQMKKEFGFVFSKPQPTGFTWNTTAGEAEIAGYEIITTVTVNGDFSTVNRSAQIIVANGFRADERNITEIVSGYMKDDIVCIFNIQGSDSNQAQLKIECGILP